MTLRLRDVLYYANAVSRIPAVCVCAKRRSIQNKELSPVAKANQTRVLGQF